MITPARLAVVYNPTKVEDLDQLRKEITTRCEMAGLPAALWFETTQSDPGAGMTREALAAGADVVLACGGDGTITACAGELADSSAALALLPLGSGNLLARNLALPLDHGAALDVAFGTGRRRLDLLEAGSRRFIVMAGLGLDAAMIQQTSDDLKDRVGWPAYLVGGAKAIRRSRPVAYTVTLDDGQAVRFKAVGALIGNVGQLQGGIGILPDALPDSGMLDVAVFTPHTVADWFVLGWNLLRRRHGSGPQAHLLCGRRVRIETDTPVAVEYDGEDGGLASDVTVSVLPGAILTCVAAS